MAQTIKLKRSATQNAVPSTSQLELGEVAINTYDGKMYIKKNDGSDSIVEIGGDATSSSGLDFTGNLNLEDDVRIVIGDGNDLQIWHGGVDSYITNDSGHLQLIQKANDKDIQFYSDDGSGGHAEYLRMDGALGYTVASKHILFNDNVKARFGNSADLQIVHDGFNSYIDDGGTGSLLIRGSEVVLGNGSKKGVRVIADGAVQIRHNDSTKIETTSAGATVTGTMLADAAKLTGSGFTTLTVNSTRSSGNIGGMNFTASDTLKGQIFGSVEGELKFAVNGSTEAMRIDASGRLLIGTTSSIDNLSQLHIVGPTSGRAGITLQDGDSTTQKTFFTQSAGTSRISTQSGTSYGSFVVSGWNGTTSADLVRVTGDGRVGIGTNAPSSPLHINDSSNSFQLRMQRNSTNYWGFQLTNSSLNFYDFATSTAPMVIDSSGQVGIGTTSPSRHLHVLKSGTTSAIMIEAGDGSQSSVDLKNTEGQFRLINDGGSFSIYDQTDTAERMRIDTSGNLLVGKTSAGIANVGVEARDNGLLFATADGHETLKLNRLSSDGTLAEFKKDGTTVGTIGADGGDMYLRTGITGVIFNDANNAILPYRTNAEDDANIDLGHPSYRFQDFFLSGNIQMGGNLDVVGQIGAYNNPSSSWGTMNFRATDYIFKNSGGTEKMRLDSSGNLLVGKTAADFTVAGHEIKPGGFAGFTRDGGAAIIANRLTSDGDIIEFYKGGTSVGSIGVVGGDILYIGTSDGSDAGLNFDGDNSRINPCNGNGTATNGALDLGQSGGRFKDLYLSGQVNTGTISSGNITTSGTITFSNSHYLQAGTGSLFFKNSSNAALGGIDAAGFNTAYNYQISGTTVIDGSRNITSANITTTGYIRGPATFTIDPSAHGDNTGTVVIAGNLQVDGTTTTINSTTLTVDDKNITLASGAANAAAANGAGLTVDGASATLTYVSSTDSWDFNKKVKFDTVQGHGSNNFLIDSPAEIHLDSHSGFTRLRTQGGDIGLLQLTNNDLTIRSMVSDRDIIFQGYDGSTNITALTLDMSDGGGAHFSNDIYVIDSQAVRFGTDQDFRIYSDGSNTYLVNSVLNQDIYVQGRDSSGLYNMLTMDMSARKSTFAGVVSSASGFERGNLFITQNEIDVSSGNLTLDVAGDIILDADGNDVVLKDNGTTFGQLTNDSGNLIIYNSGSQMLKGLSTGSNAQFMGSVGIGTSPSYPLEVSGAGTVSLAYQRTGTGVTAKKWGFHSDNSNTYWQNITDSILAITVSNAGNVGIGTTSPDGKLHISGTTSAPAKLIWERSDGGVGSKNWTAYIDNTHDLLFGKTDDSGTLTHDYLHIQDNGNVGIGTASPTHKLHVNGQAKFEGAITAVVSSGGGAALSLNHTGNENWSFDARSGSGSTDYVDFGIAGGTRCMTWQEDGKIGVGTNSPEGLMHFSASSDYDIVFDNTSQEKFRLRHGTSGIYLTGPDTNTLAFGVDQSHDVRMFNTSGSAYAVFDGSTSRVGIGTISPSAKLHISGNSDLGDADCMLIIDDVDGSAGSRIPAIMFRSNTGGSVTNQGRIRGTGHEGMVLSGSSALGDDLVVRDNGVGIGTVTPYSGTNVKSLTISAPSYPALALQIGGNNAGLLMSNSSGTDLYALGNKRLQFKTNDTTRIRIAGTGGVTFNEEYTFPTSDGSPNQVLKTDGSGNLSFVTIAGAGAITEIEDADGDTKIQVEESSDEDKIRFDIAGTEKVILDSSNFSIESGGFRVDDPGNNYPFRVTGYGYMTTRSASIAQLNGTDHANVPLSVLADVNTTRTASYVEIGDIGSAGNRFKLTNTGRVGIGITSPSTKFQVKSEGADDGLYFVKSDNSNLLGGIIQTGSGDGALVARNTSNSQTVLLRGQGNNYITGGNVGIGTTSPGAKLHVYAGDLKIQSVSGTGGQYLSFDNTHTGGREYRLISTNDSHGSLGGGDFAILDNDVSGNDAAKTRLLIDSSGNVGIGTTSPSYKLQVNGSGIVARFTDGTSHMDLYSGSNLTEISTVNPLLFSVGSTERMRLHTTGGLSIGTATSAPNGGLLVDNDIKGNSRIGVGSGGNLSDAAIYKNSDTNTGIIWPAADNLAFTTGGAERVRINGTGVGIGTSSPESLLTLENDNAVLRIRSATTTTKGLSLQYNHSGNFGRLLVDHQGNNQLAMKYHALTHTFGRNDSNQYVTIADNGNVGIGTTSPAQKLHVNGNAEINGSIHLDGTSTGSGGISYGTGTTQPSVWFWGEDHNTYPGQIHIVGRSDNAAAHSGEISFWDYTGSSWNRNMLIQKTGNVNIGTSTAFTVGGTAKLSISTSTNVYLTAGASNSDLIYSRRQGAGHFQSQAYNGGNNGTIEHNPYGGKVGVGTAGTVSSTFQVEALGIDTTTTSTTATTQVAIDTFAAATFRSAEFTIQVTNSTDSTYHLTKVLLIHDGTTPGITEYGTVFTGSAAEATFDADISSGNVRLLATPASTDSMTFKVVRHCITV